MQTQTQPIKLSILFGEEIKSNSLSAYKAENRLKKEVNNHQNEIIDFFGKKYQLPSVFNIKKLGEDGDDEFSLVEIINSKLTNSSVSVCLETYEIFQRKGIKAALEELHLKSNFTII